ncbi:hypothetical protein GPECTOR_52g34 [Gonium pectorale]|uniref:Uncharacterized protein n=1 Tax=Gonium pectorale TaxID=33097 RepID=A0A150G791_GONPE|nr:hypothetical protein GPECTOR_52g34 [Gonium pectorale]|eukprot:KXZ45633.1 hypothetical protein GPECTOR_52g34 [Gonium pectorale]
MSCYAPAGAAAVTTPTPATKWQADRAKRPGQQQAAHQQQGAGGGAGVLQAAFDNNIQAYRAKQVAQPAQSAQPAQPAQQPAVAATAEVFDAYWEELYAPAKPALITCHEAICHEQQTAGGMSPKGTVALCATLKKQQLPVSFTPAPIPEIKSVAPKAQRKPATAAEGVSGGLASTFTLSIPFTLDQEPELAAQLQAKMLSTRAPRGAGGNSSAQLLTRSCVCVWGGCTISAPQRISASSANGCEPQHSGSPVSASSACGIESPGVEGTP